VPERSRACRDPLPRSRCLDSSFQGSIGVSPLRWPTMTAGELDRTTLVPSPAEEGSRGHLVDRASGSFGLRGGFPPRPQPLGRWYQASTTAPENVSADLRERTACSRPRGCDYPSSPLAARHGRHGLHRDHSRLHGVVLITSNLLLAAREPGVDRFPLWLHPGVRARDKRPIRM